MLRLIDAGHRLSRWLVWLGGALILGSAVLVTVEVFVRKLFNMSIAGADEISGYAFGVATSLGLAFALFERAHIRVDALFLILPRPLRIFLNFFGLALLIGFAGIVTWMASGLVADTLEHGSRSITPMRTPLAIPQIPWLAGWMFFVLCGVLLFVGSLFATLTGNAAEGERRIGVKTLEEQIHDETA
ncbi:TRAP transporter small permease subunit [Nisaea sediminum]|uniref:TRAP transporter small permease subunit n=1 Tax=Nisaea sediminum TaxID=2775867 RepID=UPI001865BC0A|nr:TRAP transporter small permease [Nisaea sediminum]